MDKISNLTELATVADTKVGFMVCAVFFDGVNYDRYLLTKEFPKLEMLPSMVELKKLVVENLEQPFVPKPRLIGRPVVQENPESPLYPPSDISDATNS